MILLYEEQPQVKKEIRSVDLHLTNLELHSRLQRVHENFIQRLEVLIDQPSLEGLQKEVANLCLCFDRYLSEVTHCQVSLVQLILLVLLLLVFLHKLVNEHADQVCVDHCIDHVDAEHHYKLIGASSIDLHQGKGNSRVVPRCEPLVEQNIIFSLPFLLTFCVGPVFLVHFYIDCAKINCRDPALVGFETEPHDASDDMGVDKDKEGVVHNLHEGLVFDRDRQFANFLQDFLETLHFQKRHYVCEQKVKRIRVHACCFSDLIERES